MIKPFVSEYITVSIGNGDFRVIAKTDIPDNTTVEVCPTLAISNRALAGLIKSNPKIEKKIIVDREIIDREYEVFARLGELDLERKLDNGDISPAEYSALLRSRVNINSILDAKAQILPLGNGLLYEISETPNLIREYHTDLKVCVYKTVQSIRAGQELTYYN